jgi:hypothetical protein
MYGNWHAAGQMARDHQDELVYRAAQARIVTDPARRSLRERASAIVAFAPRRGQAGRPAGSGRPSR